MRAWHFVGDKLLDGRPVPADGELLRHDGPLVMCVSGLHASVDPFDALQFAPGSILCLVDVGGEIEHGDDKLVARQRTIIRRKDVEPMLRLFARRQAQSVLKHWIEPVPTVVVKWLETGDETIRSAAESAAWSAVESAAESAAWSAAESAAKSAAELEARAAARAAAWSAARAAAWSEAKSAARTMFNSMVNEEFGITPSAADSFRAGQP